MQASFDTLDEAMDHARETSKWAELVATMDSDGEGSSESDSDDEDDDLAEVPTVLPQRPSWPPVIHFCCAVYRKPCGKFAAPCSGGGSGGVLELSTSPRPC